MTAIFFNISIGLAVSFQILFSIDEGIPIASRVATVKAYGLDDDADIRYGISGTFIKNIY